MFRVIARSRIAFILVLASLCCCQGSRTDNIDRKEKKPGVELRLSSETATVEAGGSTVVSVEITRSGGFEGAVEIDVTGEPEGVEVAAGTIDGADDSLELTISAAGSAAIGTSELSVNGAAEGVTIVPAALALSVSAPEAQTGEGMLGTGLEGEAAGDQFGTSLAFSGDGRRVVIGAPLNDGSAASAGHARVFESSLARGTARLDRRGADWLQLGTDLDGEAADDRFGGAVAISDDGTRIAVGSYLNDGGGSSSGHVRVLSFERDVWTQVGADIDGSPGDGAGWAVAMSASGHRLVVGGPGVGSVIGDVRVYELLDGAWVALGATITDRHELGTAVAMSDDGARIALSLPSASGISRPGTTRVFDWNGSAWTQVGADIEGEAIADGAGSALSVSGDGDVIAIGAPQNLGGGADGGGIKGGHVRTYRLASGAWTQLGSDLDGAVGESFGTSVSLSADGTRLLAGGIGVVRFYTRSGETWLEDTTVDFGAAARTGEAVAISADGHTAGVAATYFRGVAGSASGAVRIYTLP